MLQTSRRYERRERSLHCGRDDPFVVIRKAKSKRDGRERVSVWVDEPPLRVSERHLFFIRSLSWRGEQLIVGRKVENYDSLGMVAVLSASTVTSTFAPGFRLTSLPFSSFKVFSTRISL